LIIPQQKCFTGEQAKFAQVDIELGFYFLSQLNLSFYVKKYNSSKPSWFYLFDYYIGYLLASQIYDMLTLQVNLGVYVADGKYELSVLVDRAVGAASIQDGQLEIMLHRY